MERRGKVNRGRAYLGARAIFSGTLGVDCVIRDLTDAGARLVFAEAPPAVREFELVAPTKGWRRRVAVAWRKDRDLGVEFTAPTELDQNGIDRLRQLEHSNAKLRSEIDRLNVSM